MRGSDKRSGCLFSYVDLEARVRRDHPLRAIRHFADAALEALSVPFAELYSSTGRPSIPPEMLLRAMLLQAFYTIRSERQLMERMEFDLLFRWFVGLSIDDLVWDHSVFSKNRDRLLKGDAAAKFLNAVLAQPAVKRLLSSEHFSVDGTLIEAWASMKSFRPKGETGTGDPLSGGGRNLEVNFKGEKRSNETHESTTDPDARLYRKGAGMEAKLCFIGHALMENRSGLIVDTRLTAADGHAERIAALAMIEARAERPRAGTSRRIPTGDARRSTGARRVMPATVEASASASASRRRSAGSRPWPDSAGPSSAAAIGSGGPSPLRQRRTTWCGCPSS
jgi:transposase